MSFISRFLAPEVDRHLLVDQGEFIIDEVAKHWVTVVWPTLGILATLPVFWFMADLGSFWWLAFVLAVAAFCYCMLLIHMQFMDRFVITNMRVFRVHGVLSQSLATMPLRTSASSSPSWAGCWATATSSSSPPPRTRACATSASSASRRSGT